MDHGRVIIIMRVSVSTASPVAQKNAENDQSILEQFDLVKVNSISHVHI